MRRRGADSDMNNDQPTVLCKWCGKQTPMLGTKQCDNCWELSSRIGGNINVTGNMLKGMLHPMDMALLKQILSKKH